MKSTILSKNRVLLEFPSIKELTLSMFRFSEFAEGLDGVKGCNFTFDVFVDKYSDSDGNLSYFSFWDGFNVKKSSINEFVGLLCYNQISNRERAVIKAVAPISENGYVIACVEGDTLYIKHETAHAKFYENKKYRKEVLSVLELLNNGLKQKYSDSLKALHYIDEVIDDEIHAYLIAYDAKEYAEIFPNINMKEIAPYIELLNNIYDKYE